MTDLPTPDNEDERLADGWWRSLMDDQRDTYKKLRKTKAGLARLNARLRQEEPADSAGGGFFLFLLLLAALLAASLAPVLILLFGYGID
jgi:hypothetical protein